MAAPVSLPAACGRAGAGFGALLSHDELGRIARIDADVHAVLLAAQQRWDSRAR